MARLDENRLFLAERAKAPFPVISAHAASPHAAKRLRVLRQMEQAVVDAHAARQGACQYPLLLLPVSLPQKAEQPERQTGTRQEALLHMQTTCQASACKAAITAIKVFQATGTVAREGRHSARLSATIAGL